MSIENLLAGVIGFLAGSSFMTGVAIYLIRRHPQEDKLREAVRKLIFMARTTEGAVAGRCDEALQEACEKAEAALASFTPPARP